MKPFLTVVSVVLVSFSVVLEDVLVTEGLPAEVTDELTGHDIPSLLRFNSGLACARYNFGDLKWGSCEIIQGLVEGNVALVNN